MNGNELLWPGGGKRGSLEVSQAGDDLELGRLSALLFPGLREGEALAFAGTLLTDDPETVRMRQEALLELLEHPETVQALERLLGLTEELAACARGVRENVSALRLSRLDAAVDGLKKTMLRLGKDVSRQGAELLEEAGADNRYAQLLRFTHFRRRLLKLYVEMISLLRESVGGKGFRSAALKRLGDWAGEVFEKDRIPETASALKGLEGEWKGVAAFAVDVCLDSRRNITGLELYEVREEPYAKPGMLEGAGTGEARDGVTSLLAFPQTGAGAVFQEYLLSEAGYEARDRLTRLRDALTKLPLSEGEALLDLRDALRFYTGAAAFARKLRGRGAAVCAPQLTEDVTFEFRGALLPEQSCSGELPVANDLALPNGGSLLLTGPNSSGKTCCLIMAGQLLFLGQLGCLLPAAEGRFSPRDRLLTLFASGESETGEDSRMGMEIRRIRQLREGMTPRSLFLFNEPMTSTSAREGGSICVRLLADLAEQEVPAMLVTHFNHIWTELTERFRALGKTEKLKSLVMTAAEEPEGIRYLYRLKEAPPPPSSHARAVAAKQGVSLEALLASLSSRGLDMRPEDAGWDRVRRGAV